MVLQKDMTLMETSSAIKIIKHYKKWRIENPDTWIENTINQSDLDSAISVAVFSINANGKRNPHQRRLKLDRLQLFNETLKNRISDISKCSNFSELILIIEKFKVKGIGELACYDVAIRIGCYLGIHPVFVYIHAGTRTGLRNLMKGKVKDNYIKKEDLPEPFKSSDLTCHEIEDILCIYKDKFKTSP
jgi:hypothetical protein